MLLGRAKSAKDSRLLHLNSYVAVDTLPVPPVHNMLDTTATWPMLANDKFNCCTSAAAGHMVHHWTAVNQHGVFLSDNDIIAAHAALTCDHLLDCVSMADALKYWRKMGIGQHKVHSYVSVGRAEPDDLRGVIYLFGSAYIGLDLPQFAYTGELAKIPDIPWAIPVSATPEACAPQVSQGHCVAAIGYDEQAVYAVSWGRLKTMTWEFFSRYVDEAYAVLSQDWVELDSKCPSGFDVSLLDRDLERLRADPSPQARATAS
ncbi:MAG: hypothetical protein HIU91_05875 [Acidobacteria bacterium]|nr:hypothetical protein [Acidobacteriota bacterium]